MPRPTRKHLDPHDDGAFNEVKLPLTGGCQCGAVRYEIHAHPEEIYVCHCRECRKQSASAFGISVSVVRESVRLISGILERWDRKTDSGHNLQCHFCPRCGTRLWHGDMQAGRKLSVKGGSLDEPVDISRANHIWVSRKLPGVVIPEHARQFPEEPE